MTLQQFDGERVVDIHYHKGEQVITRCVNISGCKQLNAAIGQCGGCHQLKPLTVVRHNTTGKGGLPPQATLP